jgi:hypothetical protein
MTLRDLPVGNSPRALPLPHFPTPQQAFVWRNWEMIPAARLARVLGATRRQVLELARGMGLRVPPHVCAGWLTRGTCTLIRNNWHLLPYGQLLRLLGWSAGRLDRALRDEDFLWVKLGRHKPAVPPLRYAPLTAEQARATQRLRAAVRRHFPAGLAGARDEPPFGFLRDFRTVRRTARPRRAGAATELRLIGSYCATHGDPLLHTGADPYPEGMLARHAALGVNAVWLPAILYTLAPWPAFPGLSSGWQRRLANLRALVARAGRHGIGVYLYLNEPRGLPLAAFAPHPELKGIEIPESGVAVLCTALPQVRGFLRDGAAHLFREVPDLAGIFTITMSENPTHCHSRWKSTHECPRCARRSGGEVVAEVNRLLAAGVHTVAPAARVIAWSWGWHPEWELEAVDCLPDGVELMCVSEWGLPTRVGDVPGSVVDYSISQVGPSAQSLRLWRRAQARGLRTVAKVQVNASWELSAVPYLPVPDPVERHLRNVRRAGVDGLMLSWSVGGYPGGNLELLDRSSAELAPAHFGARAAPLVRRAWRAFSRAFREYPFSCGVIYHAPHSAGPANLLHPLPTGYKATMVQGFPYDDLKTWRDIYPEEVFERQWRRLAEGWRRGLDWLARARSHVPRARRRRRDELERLAQAAYIHFRSTYLQVRYVRARDGALPAAQRRAAMWAIVREELALARRLHRLVRCDARIGFEAANHYAYTRNDLAEKVIQCEWLLKDRYRLHVFCASKGERGYADPQGRTGLAKPPSEALAATRAAEEAEACRLLGAELCFLGQADMAINARWGRRARYLLLDL